MKTEAHILRNTRLHGWRDRIAGKWHYRDLIADPAWREGWISFDTVTFNPDDGLIYCGLNAIDGDLLYRFYPRERRFECLNTRRWTDSYDVKIHRTLLYNTEDNSFYFATSLLHDVDEQSRAPGGKLVRYHPARDEYEVLGIPIPMLYIQSIAADFRRGRIYGFTYPAEALFEFDLATRQSSVLAYTGNSLMLSQPHNPVVDRDGWLWGTYAETRAWDETPSSEPVRLFKYHPEGRRFVWMNHGLPRRDDANQLLPDPPRPQDMGLRLDETRHRQDHGFCDSMVFDGERYIYAGTVAGVLCRIDTRSDRVEKVATVTATGRLPALVMGSNGTLYGAGGQCKQTQIFRWRRGSERIESFFGFRDPASGEQPERIHDIAVDPEGTLYLAENDNHDRSSYLWTARLDD